MIKTRINVVSSKERMTMSFEISTSGNGRFMLFTTGVKGYLDFAKPVLDLETDLMGIDKDVQDMWKETIGKTFKTYYNGREVDSFKFYKKVQELYNELPSNS